MFSVLILTLNEEKKLPFCLASASASDDIVVLDSGSTDRTAEIARLAGARVFVRRFDNFAGQRNFAQTQIAFKHPWVFHLDADEQLTPSLVNECERMTGRNDIDGAYAAPHMIFQGRWIRRCTDYPAWQARFVRAPQFNFIEVGHGQREALGMKMDFLSAGYRHDLSAGGENEWIEKHQRYARAEAVTHRAESNRTVWLNLFSQDRLSRRRALKQASYALPFRPILRFIYQYFLRGGFLDGGPGLRYCCLLSRYEGFVVQERQKIRGSS